jgi:DUF4097 and DUF4098 domain-containing protein YvlB
MRTFILAVMILSMTQAFCTGVTEKPVNTQEYNLKDINDIVISYKSGNVTLLKSNTDSLVIKEYLSKNNRLYYARVNSLNKKLSVKAGRRPISLFFDTFSARIEVYIPVSNRNLTVRTTSGKIEGNDEYFSSTVNMETSSGNISINSIRAMRVNLKTVSGSIRCKKVYANTSLYTDNGSVTLLKLYGNVLARTSNGNIKLSSVTGNIDAKVFSGCFNCTITENSGDVSITSSSGNITLNIPEKNKFRFHSRTSSGSLRTPFPDKLSSPITDKQSVQGIICDGNPEGQNLKDIKIMTASGSIKINWVH